MMMSTYSLTSYTDFRSLQFQYSKLKDENLELRAKLATIEAMYHREIAENEQGRREHNQISYNLTKQNQQRNEQIEDLVVHVTRLHQDLQNFEKIGIDCGLNQTEKANEDRSSNDINSMKAKINNFSSSIMLLMNKNNDLALKYERQIQRYKSESRLSKQSERQLKEEISYLTEEMSRLENINTTLLNDLSSMKRENMDFKMKLYEQAKEKEQEDKSEKGGEVMEDNSFAMDLLHYEKELLQRIFARLMSAIQHESISQALTDVYSSYESVAEVYRQKLQIEYDLEDLEREYKMEKNSRVSEHLLIELRKQIQQFRSELQKQKQVLSRQEQILQSNFISLQAADREDKKIRNYTVQIEKKLKDIKSYNETKRNSEEESYQNEKSRIKFKASSQTENIMKEMVQKDRENLDKIFRETRVNYGKKSNF